MPDASPQPRRRRLRKWALRLGVALAILIVVLIVALQVIFWTDLPRSLVIGVVERTLGLRVTAGTLSTGFFGHTTLKDVTLALPLSDESFFKVDRLSVNHTSIPGLIFRRAVEVQEVELERPNVVVRQDAAGRWNLQEVATLVARAGGSGNPQQENRPATTLRLPKVAIVDGNVRVIANNGQQADLAPLNVRGEPEATLTWKYDLSIGEQLKAVGRVAPGGDFPHEVDLSLRNIDAWVALFAPGFRHELRASGKWRGQLVGGTLSGRMDVGEARFDQFVAKGPVGVTAGETIEVRPEGLVLQTGQAALPEVTVLGGSVRTEGGAVVAERIRATLAGGTASLSARYEAAARKLEAGALWQDVSVAGAAVTSGSLNVSLTEPLADRPQLDVKLATTGRAGAGTWDGVVRVRAVGRGYSDLDWTVTADRFAIVAGRRHADFAGAVATINTNGPVVTLRSLTRPDATALTAFGQYDGRKKNWYAWINGKGPRLPGGDAEPLVFMADAWGAGPYLELKQLYLRDSDLEVTGNGYYLSDRPDPVFLNLSLSQVRRGPSPLPSSLQPVASQKPLVGGQVMGDFYVHGKMNPFDLYLQGWLTGRDLVIADKPLGDLKATLDGRIDADQTLRMTTQELSIFEGKWKLDVESPTPWDSTRIVARVVNLPLHNVGEALGRRDLAGTFNGSWTIEAPSFNPNDLRVDGKFTGSDLRAGPLVAQSMTGRTWLRNGSLFDDLTFKQDDGSAYITLSTALNALAQFKVTADVKQWPTTRPSAEASAVTTLKSTMLVDLKAKGATGTASLSTAAFLKGEAVGDATVDLATRGRVVEVRKVNANLLGGSAEGTATVDLDRPMEAVARGSWSGIDAGVLSKFVPGVDGLTGRFDGLIAVTPDTTPRPLAPLAVVVSVTPQGAQFRSMDIGNLYARLAIDFDDTWRLIADNVELNVAGGKVNVWARASQHASDDPILRAKGEANVMTTQTTVRLTNVRLWPLVRAAKPDQKPMDAQLNGEINLFAQGADFQSVVGGGRMNITEGSLVNFGPTGALLRKLNAGGDELKGDGYGNVALRVERGRLDVTEGKYFERGIEMRAVATVENIFDRKESPISGYIVGTGRPFKDVRLPFLADADEIMNLLQSQLSTFRISGTLSNIKVEQATVAEIGGSLKQLITGDVKAQTGNP